MPRRFQFSLRTLLLATCLISVFLGFVLPMANLARTTWREMRESEPIYFGPDYSEEELQGMQQRRNQWLRIAFFIAYEIACFAVLVWLAVILRRQHYRRTAKE